MKNDKLDRFLEHNPINTEINNWVYEKDFRYTILPYLYLGQSTKDYKIVGIFLNYKELKDYFQKEEK